ncbi:GNAT family N-acetyltransferase [Lapidilactobacillus bayanensis]|uniref:GNAT family N-acetyltransferase n=1 Tax=Lapidilactobacillus bayanensis TaxID=2485998 RepID=UPI000F77D637|nr:GNAT family N-acetyltransferase [Lapidilactobacillus bayanensis]
MSEVEITIRQAIPQDAAELLRFWQVEVVSCDLLETDDFSADIPEEMMARELADIYESANNYLLVALADKELIGYLRIAAPDGYQRSHVGELGIIIARAFRHQGLGQILMDEALTWVAEASSLKRVELYVQKRNLPAQKLYHQFDFVTEGELPQSFRSKDGELLTTILMARLF